MTSLKGLLRILSRAIPYPRAVSDYCYQEEAITDWKKDEVLYKEHMTKVRYLCQGCGTERYYLVTNKKDRELR